MKRLGASAAIALAKRLGEALDRRPVVAGRQRHDQVQALAAGGAQEGVGSPCASSRSRSISAASQTRAQGKHLVRVEVDDQPVGVLRDRRCGSPRGGTRSRRTGCSAEVALRLGDGDEGGALLLVRRVDRLDARAAGRRRRGAGRSSPSARRSGSGRWSPAGAAAPAAASRRRGRSRCARSSLVTPLPAKISRSGLVSWTAASSRSPTSRGFSAFVGRAAALRGAQLRSTGARGASLRGAAAIAELERSSSARPSGRRACAATATTGASRSAFESAAIELARLGVADARADAAGVDQLAVALLGQDQRRGAPWACSTGSR